MKVLFDYQAFEMQNMGGVSRSYVELCRHFDSSEVDFTIGVKESDNIYLREGTLLPDLKPLDYTHDRVFGKKQRFKGQWFLLQHLLDSDLRDINKKHCIKLLTEQQFDVFHPTFFDTYFLPYLKKTPFVLTIHDMIPELYPQYYQPDDFQIIGRRELVSKASAIIAVSENTKKDIVRILHVPEDKIHVIYHGCSFTIPTNRHRLFPFSYILYVGDRFGYKNFKQFVISSVSILERYEGLRIVCTGRQFSEEENQMFDSLGIADRMYHYRVNSDAEFYSVYHYASCFVYPSEYEGFGIPILEAYAADCPVLLNRASCFPEIAGDAAVYFSLNDPDELKHKLEYILTLSEQNRKDLLKWQRARLAIYSWQESARKLSNVYKSII